jgi:hypothetical protein
VKLCIENIDWVDVRCCVEVRILTSQRALGSLFWRKRPTLRPQDGAPPRSSATAAAAAAKAKGELEWSRDRQEGKAGRRDGERRNAFN